MQNLRKMLALVLGSVMALSMFAGCGDSGDDDKGSTGGNNTQQGGGNEGSGNEGEGGSGNEGEGGSGNEGSGNEDPVLPTPDAQAPAFETADNTFTLSGRISSKSVDVSESLFGVFLEDINHAGNLLDDNLLRNSNFSDLNGSNVLDGWTALAGATVSAETQNGVLIEHPQYHSAANNTNVNASHMKVSVAQAGGGVKNVGYTQIPIAVEKDVDYTFSAFIKAPDSAAKMTVRVTDGTVTYATADIDIAKSAEWVKYVQTVKATEKQSKGLSLEIAFSAPGSYSLDAVTFETNHSTAGIKQYVYDAIAELAPKFIRFPGGCIIEGDADTASGGADTVEVYDWKNSVGAVVTGSAAGADDIPAFTYTLVKDGKREQVTTYGEYAVRTPNLDLWGIGTNYPMDYGVGFYEYFLLCESLNASALPVLNCGMSDLGGAAQGPKGVALNGRHGKKVDDYIQDAIDLIEFAKGATTTKWGHLRELMGHPEPFEMDYVGIGNEQFGDYYTGYYEKFLESAAFRKALSDYGVKPVVGNGMFITNCEDLRNGQHTTGTAQKAAQDYLKQEGAAIEQVADYGVHDQHYYINYSTMFRNADLYDDYVRSTDKKDGEKAYEVFVGEYSANEGTTDYPLYQNSLITALSEAAAMTGFERNGDVVRLAAYAPMFGVADTSKNAKQGGLNSANNWAVDMMYYTNDTVVRSANYYVQKIFMHNQGAKTLAACRLADTKQTYTLPTASGKGGVTISKLYFVASQAENGDLIVKFVNPTPDAQAINFNITDAKHRGFAYVTELSDSDCLATNTYNDLAKVVPVESTIGWSGDAFGYSLKPYSLTVLRLPVSSVK